MKVNKSVRAEGTTRGQDMGIQVLIFPVLHRQILCTEAQCVLMCEMMVWSFRGVTIVCGVLQNSSLFI
jgi:hypothetical protein